jgi:hypothetical protein
LYQFWSTFQAASRRLACKFCSISSPAFIVLCFLSHCMARLIRLDRHWRLPGRKDRFFDLDARESISFHVSDDIHGVRACHSTAGACNSIYCLRPIVA